MIDAYFGSDTTAQYTALYDEFEINKQIVAIVVTIFHEHLRKAIVIIYAEMYIENEIKKIYKHKLGTIIAILMINKTC